jgi:hypothetical protein
MSEHINSTCSAQLHNGAVSLVFRTGKENCVSVCFIKYYDGKISYFISDCKLAKSLKDMLKKD